MGSTVLPGIELSADQLANLDNLTPAASPAASNSHNEAGKRLLER
ncbi:hypothetical protein [Streptomyces sp. NBC_00576]|nr:hypothetical protein [Streptomyces sp. NBC_00576]WUB72075.1 hypothetical protein OG734_19265 [Streptomyces sp. NBC_00576]